MSSRAPDRRPGQGAGRDDVVDGGLLGVFLARVRAETADVLSRVRLTRAGVSATDEADVERALRDCLELDASNVEVRAALALALLPQSPREALEVLDVIPMAQRPAAEHNLRAVALMLMDDDDLALRAVQAGLAVEPAHADLHINLAVLHLRSRRYAKAIRRLDIAAKHRPEDPSLAKAREAARGTRWEWIKTLLREGRTTEAEPVLHEALTDAPDDPALLTALGHLFAATGRPGAAIRPYRRALRLDRSLQRAWYGIGTACSTLGEFALAAHCLGKAIALDADDATAHHNLARALHELGYTDEALHFAMRAERLGLRGPPTALIATVIPGGPRASERETRQARSRWADGLPQSSTTPRGRGGLGRIGYVSSFFAAPGWMKPVWALIDEHDRERYEIHLFSDAPANTVRNAADHDLRDRFHDITDLDNDAVARLVRRERVDLLVDLNAYSDLARLPLFALQPAPVNVGWFNMYATSGIEAFDAIIGDAVVLDGSDMSDFVERVEVVDACYLSFDVRYDVPDVVPAPSAGAAPFTFGALATQYKITPGVVAAWSAILREVPGARLLVRNAALGKASMRRHLAARFAERGVAASRLVLLGPAPHRTYLATYGAIDLALDTFPYNGGTTTMESLWQGVPVVAFHGDRWASRISASILRHGGLDALVADDVEGYVGLAVALADPAVLERLAGPRMERRDRLRASPVCRTTEFARRMEACYERIWASAR